MKNELSILVKDLLKDIDYEKIKLDENITIDYLVYDSRAVKEKTAFVCIQGFNFDSHNSEVIENVIKSGAKLLIIEKEIDKKFYDLDISIIKVENTKKALALMSKNYFRNPAKNITLIGITGTKGKTTITFMLKKIFEKENIKTGIIGTIGAIYDDKIIKTNNTTPESFIIYNLLYDMNKVGVKNVVMEVSSQSLKLYRTYGLSFKYGLFTNISPDHIGVNEHKDFRDYFESKMKLFSQCEKCVLNEEMDYFLEVKNYLLKYHNNIITFSTKDSNKQILKDNSFSLKYYSNILKDNVILSMIGDYNISNAQASICIANDLNVKKENIKSALQDVRVPGRTEVVYKCSDYVVMIDYAHNEVGAKSLLLSIKEYNPKRIVVVFGCGGNRDKNRRYGMGKVVGELADFSIITADNSRYEKTIDIINDILSTYTTVNKNYKIIEDRREAINYAIKNYEIGDVILVIGKGHEDYNDFNGIKTHFSDKEEILKVVNEK